MQLNLRNALKLTAVLALAVALFSSRLTWKHAAAASLPATPCTGSGTVTCNLWAMPGTATLYTGVTVPIWGYSATGAANSAGLPGPALIVNEGDTVTVNLTNNLPIDTATGLPEATSMLFQGQAIAPDLVGTTNAKSYTFLASKPGTYLYEAGLLPNAQHQVAMGLYGALVVRPASAGQAYDTPASTFNEEALLVLSELDPALNNSASPARFDMRGYHPSYYLINGMAYPGTGSVTATAGNTLLLRYVNAGLQSHSMGLIGLSQTLIAVDGSAFANTHQMVSETVAPGQTMDSLVAVPTVPNGSQFAAYDSNLSLRNSNASGIGGMLAFITVSSGTGGGSGGPVTSHVALSPNPVSLAGGPVTLSATITPSSGASVTAAEYFVDTVGANGTGCAITGSLTSISVSIPTSGGTAPCTDLTTLSSGNHTFYVRGQDSSGAGTWGAVASAVLNLDKAGPTTSGLGLAPNPSNGSVSVALNATANDTASGNHNIAAAEYTIDGGAAQPMTVNNTASPIASLSATIPAAAAGTHPVTVRSQDSLGNWGPTATINLVVDNTGPTTSGVSAAPNPNNGSQGLNTSTPVVRVTASFSDLSSGSSNVVAAEGFLDTVGASGTGFAFIAADGNFNSPAESGSGDIPLPVIGALSQGNHTIYVHGKDSAGNWGATSTTTLLIDKTAPTFTGITLSPNPTNGAATVALTVNGAGDTGGSGVSGGEYWICATTCTAPAPGGGTAFTGLTASIPVGSLATGNYTVYARIRDAAGNWSTGTNGIRSSALTVWANAIFSDGFESGNFGAWSSTSTNSATRLSVTAAAALVGTRGMQAQGNNTNYAQYNFGTTAIPAAPTYDARFYFRPNGNSSTGKDIFAAATNSGFGTVLFRVRYRLNGTTPQVQIQVGTTTNTGWTNINGGTSNNVIEVVWQSGTTLQLYVNGVSSQTLTAIAGSVGAIRLGSVTGTGNSTSMFFDAFASKRQTAPLIGP